MVIFHSYVSLPEGIISVSFLIVSATVESIMGSQWAQTQRMRDFNQWGTNRESNRKVSTEML
jgi:hypothetical protein